MVFVLRQRQTKKPLTIKTLWTIVQSVDMPFIN